MKWKSIRIIINSILIICLIILGWCFNELYEYYIYKTEIAGFYAQNRTYEEIKPVKDYYNYYGDWVCIDTRGMTFKEALKTCEHEVGHEIFAEVCEKDIAKCMEIEK